jgi:hypothetical protein
MSPATGARLKSKIFMENEALKEEIKLFVRKGATASAVLPPL